MRRRTLSRFCVRFCPRAEGSSGRRRGVSSEPRCFCLQPRTHEEVGVGRTAGSTNSPSFPSVLTGFIELSYWSVTNSCPTLCDPVDCSPPGSAVHGILQAGILERVAIPGD